MCGRYSSTRHDSALVAEFGVTDVVGEEPDPSWNVAPTQTARVVLDRTLKDEPDTDPQRRLQTLTWGLIPSWAADRKIGNRLINARMETITAKPAFKRAAVHRRCLVPAAGYYEWQKTDDGKKVPYYLHRHDDQTLAFAGLYELWPDPDKDADDPDRWLWTYTVLTTTASDALGHVHDRSPVLIPAGMRDDWLDPHLTDPDHVRQLLAAVPEPRLDPHQVSTAVNTPRNNGPDLIKPAEGREGADRGSVVTHDWDGHRSWAVRDAVVEGAPIPSHWRSD